MCGIAGIYAYIRRSKVEINLRASHPIAVENAVWWPDMGVELSTTRLLLRLLPGQSEATSTLLLEHPSRPTTGEAKRE